MSRVNEEATPRLSPGLLAWMQMPAEEKARRVAIAREKAARGICFLCAHIVNKTELKHFPKSARIEHLMLCCKPKGGNRVAAKR